MSKSKALEAFSELSELLGSEEDELTPAISLEARQRLEASIPGLTFTSAQGAMPFIAEGHLGELPFHFRYRGGRAKLLVGDDLPAAPQQKAEAEFGDRYNSQLDDAEFEELFPRLVGELKPVTSPQS